MDNASPHTTGLKVARDVMTSPPVLVAPETSVKDALRLLTEHRIRAAPVIDAAGVPLGVASRHDLLPADAGRAGDGGTVRERMRAPVVTISEDTTVQEAARLMRTHAVGLLPVLRAGCVVGILSDRDLLRVVEDLPTEDHAASSATRWSDMIASFFSGSAGERAVPPVTVVPVDHPSTADAFRQLVDRSDQEKVDEKAEARHARELMRLERVRTLLNEHLSEGVWTELMAHAHATAAHGGKEIQMLRFPAALCSDAGRKINNADPAWTGTLRGEAAELFARYERELKPAGFTMAARVADYPDGMPGDVALFLVWLN